MRNLILFIASLLVWITPGAACSVEEGYKVPTNFELVQKAKAIVLARVESAPDSLETAGDPMASPMVILKPVRVLKGSGTPGELRVMGWRPPKNWQGLSTATTLWQSHFSAGLGGCVRQFYESGELVVAIFDDNSEAKKITGLELTQVFDPFARAVETVDGPNDVWVHAVELYVALQAGDPSTIKQRIQSDISRLRTIASPESQAIAADLQYHLNRGDRSGTWGSFAMPTFTSAGVDGQKGAQLYCLAGTPPGVMLAQSHSSGPPRIVIDGTPYPAAATSPTPVERTMLKGAGSGFGDKPEQPPSIYRLSDPSTLRALRSASRDVGIELGGQPVIKGQPLDALLRWANHCEKLQSLPAPSEKEFSR